MNAYPSFTRRIMLVVLLAPLMPLGCGSEGGGNSNANFNSNSSNSNENGGTGKTVDDLPDLSSDDSLGSGEGADTVEGGLILVGLDEDLALSQFSQRAETVATAVGGEVLDMIPDIHLISVVVEQGTEQQAIALALALDDVDFAERNAVGKLAEATDLLPTANSVEFAQYYLFLTDALRIRGIATAGSGQTTVAVVDSGYQRTHPEFSGATIFSGLNYVSGTTNVEDAISAGHGTGIVGILAASVGGQQLSGLLPGFDITVHKVSDNNGNVSLASAVLGIVGAMNGNANLDISTSELPTADVIYVGFSFSGDYDSLARAIFEAEDRGVVVVAPAGNNGRGSSASEPRYPAGYSTVLGVGASDIEDQAAPFSNRWRNLEIVAPGVDLLVAAPTGTYRFVNGTSYAAAIATAGAAWLVDRMDDPSPANVRNRLNERGNSLPAGSGFSDTIARRLNIYAALRNENDIPEPYIIRDDQLVLATGVSVDTLAAPQAGQSQSSDTPEAYTEETMHWYGYFPSGTLSFEIVDGEDVHSITPETEASSSIDLFLEFLRGIDTNLSNHVFSVMQQVELEMPDLGGVRREMALVARVGNVSSDPRTFLYNPLKKGYNIVAYKNFDSALWHYPEFDGEEFDPVDADIQLLGSSNRPEINWSGIGNAHRILMGSSLSPEYLVTSEPDESDLRAPVRLGACAGADTAEQICGDDIALTAHGLSRILVLGIEGPSTVIAGVDVIYVP